MRDGIADDGNNPHGVARCPVPAWPDLTSASLAWTGRQLIVVTWDNESHGTPQVEALSSPAQDSKSSTGVSARVRPQARGYERSRRALSGRSRCHAGTVGQNCHSARAVGSIGEIPILCPGSLGPPLQ
jgi:hypothetical protein